MRRSVHESLPPNVERIFGLGSTLTQTGVRALLVSLANSDSGMARELFEAWRAPFAQAVGRDLDEPSPGLDKLAMAYGLRPSSARQAELLFAVHTYFAAILKCVAADALGAGDLADVACARNSRLRRLAWERIERGDVFHAAGVVNLLDDDRFGWCASVWSPAIDHLVRQMANEVASYAPAIATPRGDSFDALGLLHHQLFPKAVRRELGEYYTPPWLVDHLLDALEYPDDERTLLDPSCGSGAFLLAAIRRLRCRAGKATELPAILAGVAGFDLNPLAVLAARTNYLLAVRDLLPASAPFGLPVYCVDAILGPFGGKATRFLGNVDLLAGNPPWIAWDRLPLPVREATRPLWERYGLFSLSANAARHGGAKKDLSSLFLYAVADRFLKGGGKLGFVITQTLFQSKGAGDGFRRFRLGVDGEPLKVLRIDDMSRFQPFSGANNWTSTIVLAKGEPTSYPVPYFQWTPEGAERRDKFRVEKQTATPIDPRKPTSPWVISPAGLSVDPAKLAGPSDYVAYLGANTGGASGVYWLNILRAAAHGVVVVNLVETGKKAVARIEREIERDLLYPLLRWGDVARWRAKPAAYLLLAQDPAARRGIDEGRMAREFPRTYEWLTEFRPLLEKRAAWRHYQEAGPFYSMYNVGPYTLAPIKVVWRRMDKRITAAVAGDIDDPHLGRRCLVPQETCSLVDVSSIDEANYLCAMLNSAVANFLAISHSVRQGKGFGTPSMLDYLPIERFESSNESHRRLAALGLEAHQSAEAGGEVYQIEEQIDRVAAALWNVSLNDLAVMQRQA